MLRHSLFPAFSYLIGLSFALYVFRFQFFDINFSLLRLLTITLIGSLILYIHTGRSFPIGFFLLSVLVLIICVINLNYYFLLPQYPLLQKEIAAHIVNLVTMVSIVAFVNNKYKFEIAIKGYVYASVIALFIAYYAYFFGHIPFEFILREHGSNALENLNYLNINDGEIRLTGPFYDPNFYGVYLLTVIVFSTWLYNYVWNNKFYIFISVASIFSLLATLSRTAIVGFAVFYIIYILKIAKNKFMHCFFMFFCLSCIFTIYLLSDQSLFRVFDTTSALDRIVFYERGWAAFVANPIIGGGPLPLLDKTTGIATAHMVYLSLLGKFGLAGTMLYLFFVFLPPLYVFLLKNKIDSKYRNLIYFLYAPLAIMYFSYDFLFFLEFQYFLFAIGYIILIYPFTTTKRPERAKKNMREITCAD